MELITLTLPKEIIEEIKAVAKLAGVSPEVVARIILALYVRKLNKE